MRRWNVLTGGSAPRSLRPIGPGFAVAHGCRELGKRSRGGLNAYRRWICVAALSVLGVALSASALRAQPVERIFADANQAFFEGDHARAIEGYEELVAAGVRDPDVYFNLATAYARDGRLGRAVLNFERVLWLAPGDTAAEAELRATQDILANRRAEREGEAMVRARPPIVEALARPFSLDALAVSTMLLDVLFFGLLLVRKQVGSESVKLGIAIALPLVALLWITVSVGLSVKAELWTSGEKAVVVEADAPLREGPDGRAQVRSEAQEGQTVRVLASEGDFRRVRLPGGRSGWLHESQLGEVRAN